MGTTGDDPERELALVNLMRQQGVAAVVLLGGAYDYDEYQLRMARFARSLDAAGSHLVLVGRPPLEGAVPATTVDYDNEGGAYAMASHLLSAGHRKVLVLPGHAELTTAQGRLNGARRAFEAYGVPFEATMVRHGPYDYEHGYAAVEECLRDGLDFTAVLAGTDVVAAGAMQALRAAGLRVPEDVSIVGYDDIPLASQLTPQLTTVHVPYEEMGRVALRAVADRREGAGRDARGPTGTIWCWAPMSSYGTPYDRPHHPASNRRKRSFRKRFPQIGRGRHGRPGGPSSLAFVASIGL